MVTSDFIWSFASANAFELAIAWPTLTAAVASALFDGTWRDHVG
jgi:hypothetical protein